MTLLAASGLILLGLMLLFAGGEILVKGAVNLARKLNLSEIFIGIVLVGFGTSLPETLTVFSSARMGDEGLGLGNIIGSNIANIGLILALGLAIATTKQLQGVRDERTNYVLMLVGLLVFAIVALIMPVITKPLGAMLVASLLVLLFFSWKFGSEPDQPSDGESEWSTPVSLVASALGFIFLVGGAHVLVKGAVSIATMLGVSEFIIGLTLVAIGTSLPELAATLSAARHGKLSLTVGNVIGSNIFNVLAAVGIGAFGGPLATAGIGPSIAVAAVFSLLMIPLFSRRFAQNRLLGWLMLLGYVGYIIWLGMKSF